MVVFQVLIFPLKAYKLYNHTHCLVVVENHQLRSNYELRLSKLHLLYHMNDIFAPIAKRCT